MSLDDARVVGWQWRPKGVSLWITDGEEPTALIGHEMYETRALTPLSLLVEAESRIADYLDDGARRGRTITALVTQRDALQEELKGLRSRLDAVVGLADDMAKRSAELLEDHCTVAAEEVEGYEKQLRSAALGGESPGNEEVV